MLTSPSRSQISGVTLGIEAPVRAVLRVLGVAAVDDEVDRAGVVGQLDEGEAPVLVLPEEGFGRGPVRDLGSVDGITPEVETPEVAGAAGRVVAVVAGGSVVVDQCVRARRSRRSRELHADVDNLVGGEVSGEVVDDGAEGQLHVVLATEVAGVVEHAVRRVVVRADRHVVAVPLANGERDLSHRVGVEVGAHLDALVHGVAVHLCRPERHGLAVLEADDVDPRRRRRGRNGIRGLVDDEAERRHGHRERAVCSGPQPRWHACARRRARGDEAISRVTR